MSTEETACTLNVKNVILTSAYLHSDLSFKTTNKRASIQIAIKEASSNKKPSERKLEDFIVKAAVNWNSVEECPLYRKYSPSVFLAVEFTNKCTPSIIKTILDKPIHVKDCERKVVRFVAFGYSATHLRDRKYVFYDENLGKWDQVTRQFGNFDAIKTVSKKAARIGLLFSSSTEVARLKDEEIGSPVEDVTYNDYNFTDGCGFISVPVAQKILKTLKVDKRYVHQNPPVASVYQVRIKGSKGVLMVDPKLSKGVRLRRSMIKYEWCLPAPHVLGVTNDLGLSRPYKVASLNLQFTRLLSTLGVPDQVFLDKTQGYLQDVASLDQVPGQTDHTDVQIKFLCANEYFDEAEELMGSQQEVSDQVKGILRKLKKKIITAWEKKLPQGFTKQLDLRTQLKLKIPVQDSRNVYGVCDPTAQLNYGECFFQPTVRGKPMVLDGVKAIVSKNPCYHPGDVRVLRCRNVESLHHLYDCIVFPVKGDRPHSNEIAGSDLDGDEYFVCWDKDLLPQTVAIPASYRGSSEKPLRFVTEDQLKSSFANYRNKMAAVNDLYELWANKKGAGCEECALLADYFSIAVDSAKTGETMEIPEFLAAIKGSPAPSKRFVWEKMLGIIDNFRTAELHQNVSQSSNPAYTFDIEEMECLLNDKGISVTEFMRFRLLLAWLKQQQNQQKSTTEEDQVLNLLKLIDFSHFEPQQRMQALEDLHGYGGKKAALLLVNSLYRSEILSDNDIRCLEGFESTLSWVLEDRMLWEEFAWDKVNALMMRKAVKMLVFQIRNHGDKWVLVLTVADALQLRDSIHPFESSGRTSSSAYMSVHGITQDSRVSPLQKQYLISLDGSRIQVYDSGALKRTDTFICIQNLEDDQLGMSVALNKFDQSFSKNHNNAKVRREDVEKVELFCKHRKPYQTQRFSLFERPDVEETEESEETDEGNAKQQETLEYCFNEVDFPALSNGELTEYPHCQPLVFMTEFEELQSNALEVLYSGGDMEPVFHQLEGCLEKPELCKEAALCLEFVTSHRVSNYKPKVSLCFNIISHLLTLAKAGIPRIERFVESMARLGVELSTMDVIDFLTSIMYTLPADDKTMATFLSGILRSEYGPSISCNYDMHCMNILDVWQRLMVLEQSSSKYFLHWAALLSVEQYHHMLESANKASNTGCYMKGSIFISPEGDREVIVLRIEGDNIISPTDGFAVSPLTEDTKNTSDVPYRPLFCLGITKFLNSSIIHVKLLWPCDDAILHSQIKDQTGQLKKWRIDVLPNLVSYNRMLFALEQVTKCYRENPILSKVIGTLVDNVPSLQRHQEMNCPMEKDMTAQLGDPDRKVCVYVAENFSKKEINKTRIEKDCSQRHQEMNCPTEEDMTLMMEQLGQADRNIGLNTAGNPSKSDGNTTRLEEDGSDVSDMTTSVVSSGETAGTRSSSIQQSLNDSQMQAVEASQGEKLTLVQGPPGTGKTVTAAKIIQQWLERFPDTQVLACAETNEGINNIIKALLRIGISGNLILRVGTNITDELREYSLEEKLRSHEQRDKYRYNELKLKAAIIVRARIICSTCIGAGSTELKDIPFQHILIDEAGQALEPSCLVSLRPRVKRLCLIGDEKQLPPLVISPYAQDLKNTIFSRLSSGSQHVYLLKTQYRMNPQISLFPNQKFYGGKLQDASTCQDKIPPESFRKLFAQITHDKAVIFVQVEYCGGKHRSGIQCGESRDGPSISNPKEAAVVVRIVEQLLANGAKPADIAVISPYRKQVSELGRKLNPKQVHVKTIDGFQGQERQIIIFSTVRANDSPRSPSVGHLGHLKDEHRMNVALTRAQSGLIVLGHRNTLKSGHLWKDWLEFVDKNCFVIEEMCETSKEKDKPKSSGSGKAWTKKRK